LSSRYDKLKEPLINQVTRYLQLNKAGLQINPVINPAAQYALAGVAGAWLYKER
jgi:hypothetical protein